MLISIISGREGLHPLRLLPMRPIERSSLGTDVHDDG
jgi:hypothetical protein